MLVLVAGYYTLKSENVKNALERDNFVERLFRWVICQFYGCKLCFTAPPMGCSKMKFVAIKLLICPQMRILSAVVA